MASGADRWFGPRAILALGLAILGSGILRADEHYPVPVKLRLEGIDQGETNRCFATAMTTAYEHAFEARGLSVKLSLPYSQVAHTIYNVHETNHSNRKLTITDQDRALVKKHGYLIPHYMWPEDLRYVDERHCGLDMAHPTRMARIPADFHVEMGVYQQEHSLHPEAKEPIDPAAVKNMIKAGMILTLPMDREVIRLFDHATGLIAPDKVAQATERLRSGKSDHMVALLGFDDQLYDGGGALIIKNTWDNGAKVELARGELKERDADGFKAFRGKICSTNLAGYYAWPCEFLKETIQRAKKEPKYEYALVFSHPVPPFERFAKDYARYEADYQVCYLPFSQDRGTALQLLDLFAPVATRLVADPDLRQEMKETGQESLALQAAHGKHATFKVAQVAPKAEVATFYGNGEGYRKFYAPVGAIYPTFDLMRSLPSFQTVFQSWKNPTGDGKYWETFYRELSEVEESGRYLAPYTYFLDNLMVRVDYIKGVLSESKGETKGGPQQAAAVQRKLGNLYDTFIKDPQNSGFSFKFLDSEEDLLAFYSNDAKFRDAGQEESKLFPSLELLKRSEFFRKVTKEKYKDIATREYWKLLFDMVMAETE